MRLTRQLPRQAHGEARVVGSVMHAWGSETKVDVLVWCLQNEPSDNDLLRYLLEPGLFYLALTAGRVSNQDWLGRRDFEMHVAHAHGVDHFGYPAGFVSPEQARNYLAQLATDFLDPQCLDLLPLRRILERKELCGAVRHADGQLGNLPAQFASLLEECLAADVEDGGNWNRWSTPLVELVNAQVPADAFDKIRRRLLPVPLCVEPGRVAISTFHTGPQREF